MKGRQSGGPLPPSPLSEPLYIRSPEGTRERIRKARGRERASDFMRRIFLAALEREERLAERERRAR